MEARRRTALAVAIFVGVALVTAVVLFVPPMVSHPQQGNRTEQPTGTTVAFVADTDLGERSRAEYELVNAEGADLLVHAGDFDYNQAPAKWADLLNETLGPDFPVVGTMGNHDIYTWSGYSDVLRNRAERADELSYTGDLGQHATITFRNITIVQSSEGLCSIPSGDDEEYPAACGNYDSYEPEQYVSDRLDASGSTWNLCTWHLDNHEYQVGDKSSEVEYGLYDACRQAGADLVVNGHDHAYARTYPMSDFADQSVAETSSPYTVGGGATMDVLVGAGGHSFYQTTDVVNADWWNAKRTSGTPGVFFCTFYENGTATCWYETIDGEVVDGPFTIHDADTGRPTRDARIGTPDVRSTAA